MWKLVLALLALAVIAAAAYVHYYPEEAAHLVGGTPLEKHIGTSRPLYRWKDEKGQLQVTDYPPPPETPYEVKRYPLDANVLPMSQLLRAKE